jgi:hypothetical protein
MYRPISYNTEQVVVMVASDVVEYEKKNDWYDKYCQISVYARNKL